MFDGFLMFVCLYLILFIYRVISLLIEEEIKVEGELELMIVLIYWNRVKLNFIVSYVMG